MATVRPPILDPWADTGDKVQPTDPEIAVGWPVTDIPPSRERFNWFFNFVSNAVRYITRRGLSDWHTDESYQIGDRCISPVDQKSYKAIVGGVDNQGFEPSTSPLKWERWGFTLSELLAYLTTDLYGGACPNTGPTTPPTPANPYTKYKSALGEYWEWQGDAWSVVANKYGQFTSYAVPAMGTTTLRTLTAHRAGRVQVSTSCGTGNTLSSSGSSVLASVRKNGTILVEDRGYYDVAGVGLHASANAVLEVAGGDVLTFVLVLSNIGQTGICETSFNYLT